MSNRNYLPALILTGLLTPVSLFADHPTQVQMKSCELTWQDEFNGNKLDRSKWQFQNGDGCEHNLCGWGNNEQQYYQPQNLTVADGVLTITAKPLTKSAKQKDKLKSKTKARYTSSKITSEDRFSQQYGRFEARMKLPSQRGIWPAFWLLPQGSEHGWPIDGEIDILEQAGRTADDARTIIGAAHFGDHWPNNTHYSETLLTPHNWGDIFHTYRIDWTPNSIRWSVDNKVYGLLTKEEVTDHPWAFDRHPFYMILNVAVGGTLGGEVPADFEQAQLVVDYVRVYKNCQEPDSMRVLP